MAQAERKRTATAGQSGAPSKPGEAGPLHLPPVTRAAFEQVERDLVLWSGRATDEAALRILLGGIVNRGARLALRAYADGRLPTLRSHLLDVLRPDLDGVLPTPRPRAGGATDESVQAWFGGYFLVRMAEVFPGEVDSNIARYVFPPMLTGPDGGLLGRDGEPLGVIWYDEHGTELRRDPRGSTAEPPPGFAGVRRSAEAATVLDDLPESGRNAAFLRRISACAEAFRLLALLVDAREAGAAAPQTRSGRAVVYPENVRKLWTYLWERRAKAKPTYMRIGNDLAMGHSTIRDCLSVMRRDRLLTEHKDGRWTINDPTTAPRCA